MGFFLARGLMAETKPARRRWFELLFFLPVLLPTLVIIIAVLNIITPLMNFPFGVGGVVLTHVVMFSGPAAVAIARLLEARIGKMAELAFVEGAQPFKFLRVSLSYLRKDILQIWSYIFLSCFTSFSIPLILSGNVNSSLEVYIYRKIVSEMNWPAAISAAIAQAVILGGIFLILRKPGVKRADSVVCARLIALPKVLWVSSVAMILVLLAAFRGVGSGLREVAVNPAMREYLFSALYGSVLECAAVSVLVFAGLLGMAWLGTRSRMHHLILSYVSPSAVLTAMLIFYFVDTHSASPTLTILIIALGFTSLTFSTLYRYRGGNTLESLNAQLAVAEVLGASRAQQFFKIIFPQVRRDFCFLAGLSALWAAGDFAFSSLLAGRDLTLAIIAQSLLSGYRLEVATAVAAMALGLGLLMFLLWEILGHVGGARADSQLR